jgi:Ca-activated chloride channel homolog
VDKSANTGVQRAYQINLNALAQEQAITLADQGKPKDAAQSLRESASQLKAAADKYDDRDLAKKAEAMEEKARSIETKGMAPRDRKEMRASSYQDMNQQMAQ